MPQPNQPKTYLQVVSMIIEVENYEIAKEVKQASKEAFKKWDKELNDIFKKASLLRIWRRRWMISKNKHYIFRCGSTNDPIGMELVLSSGFTEPFPSSHDMPDWALSTRMADLMILWGISVKDSSKYKLVVKNHFVNHKMRRGIIEFDLYKLRS